MYVTRTSPSHYARKQSWPAHLFAKTLGRRDSTAETAINELKNRIAATLEKEQVLYGLSRSLREMATGDVRPIEDVIREAKREQAHH